MVTKAKNIKGNNHQRNKGKITKPELGLNIKPIQPSTYRRIGQRQCEQYKQGKRNTSEKIRVLYFDERPDVHHHCLKKRDGLFQQPLEELPSGSRITYRIYFELKG